MTPPSRLSGLRGLVRRVLPTPVVEALRERVITPLSVKSMVSRQPAFVRSLRRALGMKPVLYHFEVHITDHCNLNCKGCAHFSNLCKPTFAEIAEFEADMKRMSALFDVRQIYLLGGEPLLHPQVAAFVRVARDAFPKTRIYLMTNGTLVTKMSDEFWRALADANVILLADSYPIGLPVGEIDRLGRVYGVTVEWTVPREEFFKIPIDVAGGHDAAASFHKCRGYNNCPIIRDGRLYPCAYIAFADVFRDRFGIERGLEVSEADSVDIRKAEDGNGVLDFMLRPVPWCANCDMESMEFYTWGRSKKSIDEWTRDCGHTERGEAG